MTDWALVCLVIIAISVAIMAVIQIGVIVIGIQMAKKVGALSDEIRREIRPLIDKANRVADDAVRTTALAAAQVERVDRLLSVTAVRVEEAVGILQNAMGGPIRQGAAAVMAMRAVFSAFRHWQDSRAKRPTRDEDDALFVG